ncbi:MAG: hypothetical protein KJS97_16600 [Alphaproteobacteria bacterium]|nr:hypothetical protein [Alphaproteobacteria bacterium]
MRVEKYVTALVVAKTPASGELDCSFGRIVIGRGVIRAPVGGIATFGLRKLRRNGRESDDWLLVSEDVMGD